MKFRAIRLHHIFLLISQYWIYNYNKDCYGPNVDKTENIN